MKTSWALRSWWCSWVFPWTELVAQSARGSGRKKFWGLEGVPGPTSEIPAFHLSDQLVSVGLNLGCEGDTSSGGNTDAIKDAQRISKHNSEAPLLQNVGWWQKK